ncbi:HET-domain-containing protein, partial [Cryphonectria parasitica EP155]
MFGVKSRRRLNTQPLYSKLPPGTIRLVRLLPATSSGLECELFESTLQIARNHYNALSYTWGETNPGERAIITVNETVVGIKANLYNALRRVRQRTQPVVLWVDSLCIDQSDEADRTQQVGMMRDIYASSSEVIIWLGIRGRGDDLGESLSPDAIDIYGAFCVISMLSQGVLASKIWYLRHLDHSPPIIRGLNAIMQKSWWRRVWVVQETVVAQRATVCYSDMSIPWEAFSRAAECYENGRVSENLGSISYLTYGGPLGHFCRMVTEIDSTRRNWTNPYQPLALLPALRKFRDRDASDRKDKVFALVGLVKAWGLQAPLLPDYGLETWRIFWETTVRLIETSKSLAILAGTLGNHIDMGNPPSWVTDWSHPPEPHEHYRLN